MCASVRMRRETKWEKSLQKAQLTKDCYLKKRTLTTQKKRSSPIKKGAKDFNRYHAKEDTGGK